MDCKGLLMILDGLGDRSSPALHGRTPLQAASTPTLDRLASEGITGQVDPLFPGLPVGTHTGTGLLMGLAPADAIRLARGPVEAAGVGLDTQPGDVLLRCNFATVEGQPGALRIRDRRAGRIEQGTDELSGVLRDMPLGDGINANLYPASQHRAVLALSGPGLSAEVTDTDPGSGRREIGVLPARAREPQDEAAQRTAAALNRFVDEANRRLAGHPLNKEREAQGLLPANGILTRSAGSSRRLANIVASLGLRASVIAGERTVVGLGRLFGFHVVNDPGFSALPRTDLAGKVAAALHELETHDLVFLHIKGPDICSHDRDPLCKKTCLERIDQAISVLQGKDLVIGVCGDHSTDSHRGRHCGDPVPGLITSPYGRCDSVTAFSEIDCQRGGLGRIPANAFVISLLDAMGAIGNYQPSVGRLVF